MDMKCDKFARATVPGDFVLLCAFETAAVAFSTSAEVQNLLGVGLHTF
jgi:hypothetical protein